MYLQLTNVFLLMAVGSRAAVIRRNAATQSSDPTSTSESKIIRTMKPTATDLLTSSPGITSGIFGFGPVIPDSSVFTDQNLKHRDVSPSTTSFVTIQTSSPSPPKSTTSSFDTVQSSAPAPIIKSIKLRAIEDWYTDNHRSLNKFGRFVFRVTRLGKRLFLYLTSSVEFIHDEEDSMINISDLTPEELASLISGSNITAIIDARTNSTIFLNDTVIPTINTTSTFLRRRNITTSEGEDTLSPQGAAKPAPLRPLTAIEQLSYAFRNLGYSLKSIFVTELYDERTQRERLARGQITQWEFDHWLDTASKEPTKTLFSTELDKHVVNDAYTKWAMARMRYTSRPVEFAGGRKGSVNPDYVAWDVQQANKSLRPARYHFNGTRSAFYNAWQAKELKSAGPKAMWLKDGTINPLYVAAAVKEVDFETLDVQPREWVHVQEGSGTGRRLNPEYVAREIKDAKRQGRPARWDMEGAPNEDFYKWEDNLVEKANVEKRGLVVPDFEGDNENAVDDWEAWKARVRAGHVKRDLIVPDFEESENGADNWEAFKVAFRSSNPHQKRRMIIPDFDAEREDGGDAWEAWKAEFGAGHGKRDVVEGAEFDEDAWGKFVEEKAKEMFFPKLNVPEEEH